MSVSGISPSRVHKASAREYLNILIAGVVHDCPIREIAYNWTHEKSYKQNELPFATRIFSFYGRDVPPATFARFFVEAPHSVQTTLDGFILVISGEWLLQQPCLAGSAAENVVLLELQRKAGTTELSSDTIGVIVDTSHLNLQRTGLNPNNNKKKKKKKRLDAAAKLDAFVAALSCRRRGWIAAAFSALSDTETRNAFMHQVLCVARERKVDCARQTRRAAAAADKRRRLCVGIGVICLCGLVTGTIYAVSQMWLAH